MSGEVIKVLPPKTVGPSQGCLQMNLKTIRWLLDSPGKVVVATVWWGDDSKCLFLPHEESQQNRNHAQNRSYVFNICSTKEQFLLYLQHHRRLRFLVVKENNIIGTGALENLSQIYYNSHYDDYVDIYDGDSNLIADVHVCFHLTFFSPNTSQNYIHRIESYENDLHPRRAVPLHSQAERSMDEFVKRALDLEPRRPVYHHSDESNKLLEFLKAEKKSSSLLDITNLCVTEGSDETNCGLSTPSSILSSSSQKSLTSRSSTQILQDYLKGLDISERSKVKAIERIRNISPSSSLINLSETKVLEKVSNEHLPRKNRPLAVSALCSKQQSENSLQWFSKQLSPNKSRSTARFSTPTNSNANFKTQGSPPTKQRLSKEFSPSKSSGVSTKINFYRISLDRIIFNADGLRKLHGFHNVKSQHENCPQGTYIIQYQLSKVDPKFRLEKTEPIRHVSRRTLANGVIFGENNVYKVRDLRSEDVITGFKISCQFLNQRLPMFLGDTDSLVIKEATKCSLFIKAVNGLTIGKLDIQVDVASNMDTLPPPETFSEMCKEEIDELIPSSSFESFREKSNNSKYLALKAQLRTASNEKLKNIPSAQYNDFLDSYSAKNKALLETVPPLEPSSELSSMLSSSSGIFNKQKDHAARCLDFINSSDNVKTCGFPPNRLNVGSESSNSEADLVEIKHSGPTKYAIVTHEFYVTVRNLDGLEDCVVNYVFPESTADGYYRVSSQWAVASLPTNLSRPFFISLPYGISLRKFLKKSGKKSISFYFKRSSREKTIAKAVLDFTELWKFEERFRSSDCSSFISKTLSLPLSAGQYECSSGCAKVHIEYCIRNSTFANDRNASVSANDKAAQQPSPAPVGDFQPNHLHRDADFVKMASNENSAQHRNTEHTDKDAVSRMLNTTFCISGNENQHELGHPKQQDCEKPGIESAANCQTQKGGSEFSKPHFRDRENLSPIFEPNDSNKFTSSKYQNGGRNDKCVTNATENMSRLKLKETNPALDQGYHQKVIQEMSVSSSSAVKVSNSVTAASDLFPDDNQICAEMQHLFPTLNSRLASGDALNIDEYKKEADKDKAQAMFGRGLSVPNADRVNETRAKTEASFIVPNSSPVLWDDQIFGSKSTTSNPNLKESSRENAFITSTDSKIKAADMVFNNNENYTPSRSAVFKMDPVLPDYENDAVPKDFPSPDSGAASSDISCQDDENSKSTCLAETCINDNHSRITLHDQRRNSDSGFLGSTMRGFSVPSLRNSSKNKSSSEPNIRKSHIIPQVDDFGMSMRNVSQKQCFLARIGIVRSFELPRIRLKGTREQTAPTTYITFTDCFNKMHSSSTVVESLIPEYDSRHRAWLSTELLKDSEERLIFQVWCKRYQNEWAGPDCERDRCLGFVYCDLSVLLHSFPYAGGWHKIMSPSGKTNGLIQILVKPLQSIDFVKDLECEELVRNERKSITDLQPYNYFQSAFNNHQNDGVTSKQLLNQNILELEKTIKALQISHEKRQMKTEERNANKDSPDDEVKETVSTASSFENSKEFYGEKTTKFPSVSKENQEETPKSSTGTAKKLARFLSFRRKSRKHRSLAINEDDSGSQSSGSIVESENIRIMGNDAPENNRTPVLNDEKHHSPLSESSNDGLKSVKKSPSIFARNFSFKLRKSGRKSKVHQNALLQTLPLYQSNSDTPPEKREDNGKPSNDGRNFYMSKANILYHSL